MNWNLLATAFGNSWALAEKLYSRIPYFKTFLAVVSGPAGAILAPVVPAIISVVRAAIKFVLAYVELLLDALTVTAKNLSVLALLFLMFVAGMYLGVKHERTKAVKKAPMCVTATGKRVTVTTKAKAPVQRKKKEDTSWATSPLSR